MSATDDLNRNVQQAAEDAAKAAQQAYDAYKHLINVKAVATNGKLGALSAADTLAGAPVGDANAFRVTIGLGDAATRGTLPGFFGGDLPRNDDGSLVSAKQLLDIVDVFREISGISSGRGASPVVHTKKIDAQLGVILPNGGVGDTILAARIFTDPGISDLYSEAAGDLLRPCAASGYYPGGYDKRLEGIWCCLCVCGGMDSKETSIGLWRRIR